MFRLAVVAALRRWAPACLALSLLLVLACPDGDKPADGAAGSTPCYAALDLDSPTLPVPPNVQDNRQSDWDCLAWSSFAAVNWPAGERRGFPDLGPGVSFKTAANDAEAVWETFKEKREIFPPDGMPDKVWNSPQRFPSELLPLRDADEGFCADVAAEDRLAAAGVTRHLISVNKLPQTLDETAEVASEALESQQQLCLGHAPVSACASPNPPACCSVHGQRVGPRVWKGPAAESTQPVYYEVRLNWDYFNYVISQGYYLDQVAYTAAVLGQISLPYRTAGAKRPGDSQSVDAVTGYTTEACLANYRDPTAQTPCGVGAIQMKSAWIQLPVPYDPATDPASDDPSLYHTTQAIYYVSSSTEPGKVCKRFGTFGLIGLHLIQRLHNVLPQGSKPSTLGGAFVFSTWEHDGIVGERDGEAVANYTYANYLAGAGGDLDDPPSYPARSEALGVLPMTDSRLLPETQQVNAAAHEQLAAAGSVWQHYQLIGTQYRPYEDASTSQTAGQPFYLANLVIETNLGLQEFQGLPPGNPAVLPPQYTDGDPPQRLVTPNRTANYARGSDNITFNQIGALNQGGCMGCHGVAQQNGYAFSFVLLGGQRGADVDTEGRFKIPPPMLPKRTLALNVGPGLSMAPTDQPPPPPAMQLASTGTAPGDAVIFAAADPASTLQRWVLAAAALPTSLSVQGYFQLVNGDLMLLDRAGPAAVGKSSGIGGSPNFWRLLPYEVDVGPAGSRGYTIHLYDVMFEGVESGLVLTRAASGDGVSVEAAATKKDDPETFKRQLWRLVVAPQPPA